MKKRSNPSLSSILKKVNHKEQPSCSCINKEQEVIPATADCLPDDLPEGIGTTTEERLRGELEEQGILILQGDIERATVAPLVAAILRKDLDPSFCGEIILLIHSPGGNLADAWSLIDVMESTSIPITTIGMGMVCSGGTMVLGAGDPGKRFVMPRTEIMTHPLSSGVIGNIYNMKAYMHGASIEHQRMVRFWMTHSRYKTATEVEHHLLRPVDTYMTPKQAHKHGIVDGVVVNQRLRKKKAWLASLQKAKELKESKRKKKQEKE